ncbi:MFS transporter [Nocardia bovistercoris]|uniref:MFS transporter n=1 Tax=Nocardia bovistercoris TaxID=2785916 RepID=A0A931N1C5_9NOCA|nr:MFS transporter [Nocardia bovistercoris]MBH0778220.1 MFS transporter [Nocardia bovistercoris]
MIIRQGSNNPWRALIPLAVGTFVLGTDLFVLTGMLPLIATDLDVSVATAGQLTTLFAWTYAVASPLIAAATGSWDRRTLLGGGAALFVLGMIGQAAATTFAVMALGRIVAAIGAAAFQANAFAVAGVLADDRGRGRALAIVASGITVSTVAGVPIGIFVERWIGWRGVLWLIAVGGAVAAALVPLLPRVTLPSTGLRDRLGVLIRPPVLGVLAVSTVAMTATFITLNYLPVVVAPSVSQSLLPWLLLAMGIGQVVGTGLIGRWVDRYGPRPTLAVALLGTALGLFCLATTTEITWAVFVSLAVTGFFVGMTMVPQQHRLFALAPDAPTVALGLNGSATYLGGGLGAIIGGAVLGAAGSSVVPWVSVGIALLAVTAGFGLRTREKPAPAIA